MLLEKGKEAFDEVEKAITQEPKVIKGSSVNTQKRQRIKKFRNQLRKDYIPRKQRYEEAREILQERNSFSRTDPDATFMRIKERNSLGETISSQALKYKSESYEEWSAETRL